MTDDERKRNAILMNVITGSKGWKWSINLHIVICCY